MPIGRNHAQGTSTRIPTSPTPTSVTRSPRCPPQCLSGPAGSSTVLGFERGGSRRPFFVRLERDARAYPDLVALAPPGYELPDLTSPATPAGSRASSVAPAAPSFAAPREVAWAGGPSIRRDFAGYY